MTDVQRVPDKLTNNRKKKQVVKLPANKPLTNICE